MDDEDAKGEYYNWFGDSKRLLGLPRALFALGTAAAISYLALPLAIANRVLFVASVGTYVAGAYGRSVLGGVMGDFLGATICMLEVGCLLAMSADFGRADARAIAWLVGVVSAPQLYALCFGRQTPETAAQEC